MDDLISRKAAIDALKSCYCGGEDSCGEPWIYESHAIKAIKQLPPIQSEIIYCKDCSKHNVSISKAPYPFKEYICPLIVFRGEAQGHEFDYQFCVYGKRREVTT